MQKLTAENAMFEEPGYSGPLYPGELSLFNERYYAQRLVFDDDRLLDAAFALTKETEFSFCRKWSQPQTSDGNGKRIVWSKAIHWLTPKGGDIIVLIPRQVGARYKPEYLPAFYRKGAATDQDVAKLAAAYSRLYVPPD